MPRLSIVVPVFKVQGYLRECLDSILRQSFTDLEVIAVDDCSPDGSGRILDEYAARDGRVTVLHLPENVGLGRARNAGVERATGDYLLFLDSDDSYLDGALEAIARRLDACGDPDVLVFDHVRSFWWNVVRPSQFGEVLAAVGDRTASVFEEPALLELFAVAWNKAYRRAFYRAGGLAFLPGLYEDAPLAYEAMITAERVGCLDRACVDYRQRYQGAITRSPGRKHFDIFPQYASLFAFLDERPHLDPLRPVIFERMINHFVFCLGRPDRVRPVDRREYFGVAAAFHRRYRPQDYHPPAGRSGLAHRAVASGRFPLFASVDAAREMHRRGTSGVRLSRRTAGKVAYRALYRMQRRLPLDEHLAVYSAYWDRGMRCNPAAIEAKVRELAPHVRSVWVVRREAVESLPPGVDYVLPRSVRYWQVIARATYLVNNVNFPDYVVKREGQVHLQTHHGTPLKRMGLDQQPFPAAAAGMSFRRLLHRAGRWDYSISANPHSTEMWDRVYPCPYEHLETGYPRNDVFSTATYDDVLAIRERLGVPRDRVALLYAPTMRDYRKSFVPELDLVRIAQELGDGYVLMVRTHYFYGQDPRLEELERQGLLLDVSAHDSVEELCLASDGLITDYSSVMFDYANLDRPILTYAPDWEAYQAARGVYFDLLSGRPGETPGTVARTEGELIAALTSGAWRGEDAARLRAAFRERFCPWDDGRAAERVVRRVFLGQDADALPPVVPVAARRPPRAVHHDDASSAGRPAAPVV